jgi:DNA invertase Pin-like site-specific DNA recombinase
MLELPRAPNARIIAYYRAAPRSFSDPMADIGHQAADCRGLAQRLGGIITAEITDVGSGLRMRNLPGYDRLVSAVNAQHLDRVVVSDLSRLGRDLNELRVFFELCGEKGVEIWAPNSALSPRCISLPCPSSSK